MTLHSGDCLEVMPTLPESSVDAIVTDPPYGLEFMGERWDRGVPGVEFWKQALRVLKPGGHLLAFGGSRTYHRLACAIEDAGFEIRDQMLWIYGTGFPKGVDVSRAIDTQLGAERTVVGTHAKYRSAGQNNSALPARGRQPIKKSWNVTAPASDMAKAWDGWNTSLKPAHEPIVVARKPLSGNVATNVLEHGTGAMNVGACRIGDEQRINPPAGNKPGGHSLSLSLQGMPAGAQPTTAVGRWPSNVILDPLAAELLPEGAQRFFYCPKASPRERGDNRHPTLKPIALMRYLVRLVTPKDGVVLDPFMGSGTTGVAAVEEGFRFIGIELSDEFYSTAERRITQAA